MFATLLLAVSTVASPWRMLPIAGGGCMTGIEISPSSPNVWYSYSDVGGPYLSDDAGRTWRPLHVNCTAAERASGADRLRGLLIDPRDPDRIVFAAGFKWGRTDGLYVSRDGGRNWVTRIDTINNVVPFALACDPHSPDNVLFGLADHVLLASNDGGKSFRGKFFTDDATHSVNDATDIAWSARRPGRAYAVGGKSWWMMGVTDDGGRNWRWLTLDGLTRDRAIPGKGGVFGVAAEHGVLREAGVRDRVRRARAGACRRAGEGRRVDLRLARRRGELDGAAGRHEVPRRHSPAARPRPRTPLRPRVRQRRVVADDPVGGAGGAAVFAAHARNRTLRKTFRTIQEKARCTRVSRSPD